MTHGNADNTLNHILNASSFWVCWNLEGWNTGEKDSAVATAVAALATTTAVATAGAVATAPWSAVLVLEYCALGEMLAVGESLGHTVLVMCLGRKDWSLST